MQDWLLKSDDEQIIVCDNCDSICILKVTPKMDTLSNLYDKFCSLLFILNHPSIPVVPYVQSHLLCSTVRASLSNFLSLKNAPVFKSKRQHIVYWIRVKWIKVVPLYHHLKEKYICISWVFVPNHSRLKCRW